MLFSMHNVFRIGEISDNVEHQSLCELQLILANGNDPQLTRFIQRMHEEVQGNGWHQKGHLMLKVGYFNGAEQLYMKLLNNTSDEQNRLVYFNRLGWAKMNKRNMKKL